LFFFILMHSRFIFLEMINISWVTTCHFVRVQEARMFWLQPTVLSRGDVTELSNYAWVNPLKLLFDQYRLWHYFEKQSNEHQTTLLMVRVSCLIVYYAMHVAYAWFLCGHHIMYVAFYDFRKVSVGSQWPTRARLFATLEVTDFALVRRGLTKYLTVCIRYQHSTSRFIPFK